MTRPRRAKKPPDPPQAPGGPGTAGVRETTSAAHPAHPGHPAADPARADAAPPAGGLTATDQPVVRRTREGWRVGDTDLPDLTSAMALADLIAAELPPAPAPAAAGSPGQAGQAAEPAADPGRLQTTISQLEHALTARVRVEQAIGVLAERHRIQPRQAFEQLRSAARSRGRRVIDIASDVVASATNPLLQLPDELSRPRPAGRRGHRGPGILPSD